MRKPLGIKMTASDSDVALLHRIAKRDEGAVGLLYDKHSAHLYTLVLRILHEEADAEDALQEVFLRVWHRAGTYNESLGAPLVWMTRIARNLAIDKIRSKIGHARKIEDDLTLHTELRADERSSSPEHAASLSQHQTYIASALTALPQEQRTLIEFAYFQGYTQSELAKHFSLPLGTVKTRIRLGMMELRRRLEKVL